MIPKGGEEGVSFPELTVFASNIDDVEIMNSSNSGGLKPSTTINTQTSKPASTKSVKAKSTSSGSTSVGSSSLNPGHSPHATPSVYANQTHTFPSGNARKTLPREEFDFAANLARFDKANEFKKIQSEDLVPKGDRLVSINSPQRKLGIRESVLDKSESNISGIRAGNYSNAGSGKSVNDEIMEKFKHLTVPSKQVSKSSPILVEEGSSSEDEEGTAKVSNDIANSINQINHQHTTAVPSSATTISIPMIKGNDYEKFCLSNPEILDSSRTISAINFAHHLLAELKESKMIVLLLGVGEASATLMETFHHLLNHDRMSSCDVIAIFAAGGRGSEGKRIELSSSVKQARKKLITQNRLKFTTSLSEIVKIQGSNVIVFDALGHDGELTNNAEKGLTDWMKKLKGKSNVYSIYGIESSLLRKEDQSIISSLSVQLVTFGIPRDTISSSLKLSNSILYVDSGIPKEIYSQNFDVESGEILNESFVVEIEY